MLVFRVLIVTSEEGSLRLLWIGVFIPTSIPEDPFSGLVTIPLSLRISERKIRIPTSFPGHGAHLFP
jgi:hypothetical protein